MCKCGNRNCKGFILLHQKELKKIDEIKKRELEEDPDCRFELMDSPSSGEIFTKFYELHVRSSRT